MGKRRFPKKEGIVFKLYYGGSAPGTQEPEQPKTVQKTRNTIVEEVSEEEEEEEEEEGENRVPDKHQIARKQSTPQKFDDAADSAEIDIEDSLGSEGDIQEEEEDFGDDDNGDERGGNAMNGDAESDGSDRDRDREEEHNNNNTLGGREGGRGSAKRLNGNRGAKSSTAMHSDDFEPDELAWGPDDTYDYSQHIREPGKGVFVAADMDYTEKVLNNLNMGHKVKKLREMAGKQYIDVDDIEDKEVDDALFNNAASYTGTLDDDFVLQANGGVPVDIQETEIKRLRKSVHRMNLGGPGMRGGIDFPDMDGDFDDDYDYDDEDDDYDVDATKHIGTDTSGDAERKPRLIDEQFDHVLDQYEEANFGEYMDPRDPEVLGQHEADTDDPIFQEYIIARRKLKGPAQPPSSFNYDTPVDTSQLQPIDPSATVREESDAEGEGEDALTDLYPEKKVEQWDCDTFISTYSNLENHPKLIVEPSNKIKLSKKTGMPLGVLGSRQKSEQQQQQQQQQPQQKIQKHQHEPQEELLEDDDDSDSESVSDNLGKARSKDETPEQRKERKRLVKESKKANREKKKLVKQAYKSEEIKQTTLMVAQRVNQRVVYKF